MPVLPPVGAAPELPDGHPTRALATPVYSFRRIRETEAPYRTTEMAPLRTPADTVAWATEWIGDADREMIVLVMFDVGNRPVGAHVLSVGGPSASICCLTTLARAAVLIGGASAVLVHNHPSGRNEPSREDLQVTHGAAVALAAVGCHLLDHIIVTDRAGHFHSFAESRGMPSASRIRTGLDALAKDRDRRHV